MKRRKLPSRVKSKSWTVRIAPYMRALWGYCDFEKREIVFSRDSQRHGVDRQVFIHEMLHKLLPWMEESAVDHAATELDDALEVFDNLT